MGGSAWSEQPDSSPERPIAERVLLVDGANVVGSVPDGWWKDRAGAAARLTRQLASASLPYELIELVLEGKARAGVPTGTIERLEVVHADGSGDDEIVTRCHALAARGTQVTVATADRGLLSRLAPLGVASLGPRELRVSLDQ